MIEIFFLFIFLVTLNYLIFYFKIKNFSNNLPPLNNLRVKNYLIPFFVFIDLENIPVNTLLNSLSNYKETLSHTNSKNDNSRQSFDNNFKVISCITDKKQSSESIPLLNKINSVFLKNKTGIIEFQVIQSIMEKAFKDDDLVIKRQINLGLHICLLGILVLFIQHFLKYTDLLSNFLSLQNTDNSINEVILYSLFLIFFSYTMYSISYYFIYSNSLKIYNENLNNFYLFIQSDLVPMYSNNLSENLFNFSQNLNKFNKDLSNNLNFQANFYEKSNDHLVLQEKILNKFQLIDPVQIAQTNIQILKELNNNIHNFKVLNEHFSNLNHIVEISSNLFIVAERIFDKFTNFDSNITKIAEGINLRIQESSKLLEFLGSHLSTLENRKNEMDSIIIATDNILKNSYNELIHSESEILLSFKESTNSSTAELKKIVHEYVRQSKEISLDLYNNINLLNDTFKNVSVNPNLNSIGNQNESFQFFTQSLKEIFAKLETNLNIHMENNSKKDEEFLNLIKSVSIIPENMNINSSSNILETDLQKLLTQINLNQIYFENILKELLKELRNETNKSNEIAKISYLSLTKSKIKNIFSK